MTAGDKPTVGRAGYTDEDLGSLLDAPPAGERTADKPRADLVALFDAFAHLPEGHASLSLFSSEYEPAFRAWAAQHGHRITETPLYNQTEGRWTSLAVTLTGGWITVHLDSVQEQPATEGSV